MQLYEQEICFFLKTFQFRQDEIFKDERDFSGQKHLHSFYSLATSIQETSFKLKWKFIFLYQNLTIVGSQISKNQ